MTLNISCSVNSKSHETSNLMSRENRLRIRPGGFILKNRIEVDIKALNILSCRFLEAFMHTL